MSPTTGEERAAALATALEVLACPLCGAPLTRDAGGLLCSAGHRHDVARQGYAALAAGSKARGDTAPMVRARTEFLDGGHFEAVTEAVVATVPDAVGWCVDLAGGPGFHLARVLAARPALRGVGLDVSAPAARAAAGAHPRLASATADVWRRIPVRDGAAQHVLGIFGPRNGSEVARLLSPVGRATIVTPLPAHLGELRVPFGTLGIAEDKQRRVDEQLAPLVPVGRTEVVDRRLLDPDAAAAAVLMGPTGHHLRGEEVRRIAAATGPVEVTVAVMVAVYAR